VWPANAEPVSTHQKQRLLRFGIADILNTLTKENEMTGKTLEIKTEFVDFGIDEEDANWMAFIDDEKYFGKYGFGATEQEAIDNLKEQLE
jgi:hypothetical protein